MGTSVCVQAHTCMEARAGYLPQSPSPHFFFEADSLSTPCPSKLQGFTCLRLPVLRLQMCTATSGFLCEGWGPELGSLKLAFLKWENKKGEVGAPK